MLNHSHNGRFPHHLVDGAIGILSGLERQVGLRASRAVRRLEAELLYRHRGAAPPRSPHDPVRTLSDDRLEGKLGGVDLPQPEGAVSRTCSAAAIRNSGTLIPNPPGRRNRRSRMSSASSMAA